jgi:uncharacterized SAM-binding protein YcdF (DUF218 family)
MLIALKTVLHTLLLPPGGPLLLAIAGTWLIARRGAARSRRAGWVLLVAGLAALWLLAIPLVADVLSRAAQRCPPLDLGRPLQAQAIVILGGEGERPVAPEYGGEPAVRLSLLERLNYGAFIARRTGLPVAISGSDDEAPAMRVALARDFGVDTRWTEDRSRDTFENAQFCSTLLRPVGITRIVLVTDAGHEWRAMREFVAAGFTVVPAPVGLQVPKHAGLYSFIPSVTALADSTQALYELIGNVARVVFEKLHLRRHSV